MMELSKKDLILILSLIIFATFIGWLCYLQSEKCYQMVTTKDGRIIWAKHTSTDGGLLSIGKCGCDDWIKIPIQDIKEVTINKK